MELAPFNHKNGITMLIGDGWNLKKVCEALLVESSERKEIIWLGIRHFEWPFEETFLDNIPKLEIYEMPDGLYYSPELPDKKDLPSNSQIHNIVYWDDSVCESLEPLEETCLESKSLGIDSGLHCFLIHTPIQ